MTSPSSAKTLMAAPAKFPRVSGCQLEEGKITVSIVTQTNQSCIVIAVDRLKAVQATRQVTVTNNSATVYFDGKDLPAPVFFEVSATPVP